MLNRLVQQHDATCVDEGKAATGAGLSQLVKDEFDAFLECGILGHGFLRLRCGDGGHDKRVAASGAAFARRAAPGAWRRAQRTWSTASSRMCRPAPTCAVRTSRKGNGRGNAPIESLRGSSAARATTHHESDGGQPGQHQTVGARLRHRRGDGCEGAWLLLVRQRVGRPQVRVRHGTVSRRRRCARWLLPVNACAGGMGKAHGVLALGNVPGEPVARPAR